MHRGTASTSTAGPADPVRRLPFHEGMLETLLEIIPEYTLVLTLQGRIVTANSRLLRELNLRHDEITGKAPGDALGCIFRYEGPGGCMTGAHCISCGARTAFSESIEQCGAVSREYLVTSEKDEMTCFDFQVETTPLLLENMSLIVCVLKDISAEKRRSVLEKTFFHDVMNQLTGICNLAAVLAGHKSLPKEKIAEYSGMIGVMSDRLVDDVHFHRKLLSAEKGMFAPEMRTVGVLPLLKELQAFYSHHPAGRERTLTLGEVCDHLIVSDVSILRRILSNLVINALEAVSPGDTVTMRCEQTEKKTIFSVHNPGVMPKAVQNNLFRRSFSTKSVDGRGLGTYSVKLFGERYLKGKVDFISRELEGTTFYFVLNDADPHALLKAGTSL
jgi:K+-sensing histidine kinase KdpD